MGEPPNVEEEQEQPPPSLPPQPPTAPPLPSAADAGAGGGEEALPSATRMAAGGEPLPWAVECEGPRVLHEGWMEKRGAYTGTWRRRLLRLGEDGVLRYCGSDGAWSYFCGGREGGREGRSV